MLDVECPPIFLLYLETAGPIARQLTSRRNARIEGTK